MLIEKIQMDTRLSVYFYLFEIIDNTFGKLLKPFQTFNLSDHSYTSSHFHLVIFYFYFELSRTKAPTKRVSELNLFAKLLDQVGNIDTHA